MSAASGARSLRAIAVTASTMDVGERLTSSSTKRRDAATALIGFSEPGCKRTTATGECPSPSGADFEIHRARKSVGDRRPLLDVGHQRVDLALRNALAFHVDLDPNIREADRLLADVARAPHRGDVEIALELKLELVDDPAAMHRVGVQADRQA